MSDQGDLPKPPESVQSTSAEGTLTRRKLLTRILPAAVAAAALGLTARSLLTPESEVDQEEEDIFGPVPGEYSQLIQEYRLVPIIFERESPQERVQMAIDYIHRFNLALVENPSLQGEPLSAIGINSPTTNYPIAIPSDWTLLHLTNAFIGEIAKGKTKIIYTPGTFIPDQQAGTESNFVLKDGIWQRETRIFVDDTIMTSNRNLKQGSFTYKSFSDAELAVVFVHEYCHGLQDEKILDIILQRISHNPQLAREIEASEQTIKVIKDQIAQDILLQLKHAAIEWGINEEDAKLIEFNEAQANAVEFLFLYTLNQLNRSRNFPGTRLIDPEESDVKKMRKEDPRFTNLYQHFVKTVIQNRSARDKDWLLKHVSS